MKYQDVEENAGTEKLIYLLFLVGMSPKPDI